MTFYEMKLFIPKNANLNEEQRLGIDRYKTIQMYLRSITKRRSILRSWPP